MKKKRRLFFFKKKHILFIEIDQFFQREYTYIYLERFKDALMFY
jgi:hypothetical protein